MRNLESMHSAEAEVLRMFDPVDQVIDVTDAKQLSFGESYLKQRISSDIRKCGLSLTAAALLMAGPAVLQNHEDNITDGIVEEVERELPSLDVSKTTEDFEPATGIIGGVFLLNGIGFGVSAVDRNKRRKNARN